MLGIAVSLDMPFMEQIDSFAILIAKQKHLIFLNAKVMVISDFITTINYTMLNSKLPYLVQKFG